MLEALDIDDGGAKYLPYAQALLRKLKATLIALELEHGRKQLRTPDGAGMIYVRTRRSDIVNLRRVGEEYVPFQHDDPVDEWLDSIKIELGGAGGYWVSSTLFTLGANPVSASPIVTGNFFLPFSGRGGFKHVSTIGPPRSFLQHIDTKPFKASKAYSSSTTEILRKGIPTAFNFNTTFTSLGFFKHEYVDPVTFEDKEILLAFNQTAAFVSANNVIITAETGGVVPTLLTRTGHPTSANNRVSAYVTADGRRMLWGGSFDVDIDFARTPHQVIWTPVDFMAGSTTGNTTNTTAKTVTTKTWTDTQEVRVGSTPWARAGHIEEEIVSTNQFAVGPVIDTKDYVGLNADGTRVYITIRQDFTGGGGGSTAVDTWTSDADLASAESVPELAIPPYTHILTANYTTGGEVYTGLVRRTTITVGDTAVEFDGNVTTVVASGTWDESFQSGGGGDYPDPDPAHPYSGSGSSVTVAQEGGVSILFVDPHSEFVVYVTSYNVTTTTRVAEMEGDQVLGGTSSGTVTTQTTTSAKEYGIISSARGREILWTEPGNVGAPNTVPMDPLVVIPTVSIGALQSGQVGWPSFSLGEPPASGSHSFSVGGVTTPNTYSTNVWGANQARPIQSNITANSFRIGFAGRDPQNWIASISRLRLTDGGTLINPHQFWVRTARLDDGEVEQKWYDAIETRLRAIGNTAVADAVKDRNFVGLERDFHQHVSYNSAFSDSVGSYITTAPEGV